ncbi:MAG: GTP 3',8-cyclase MoaA [Treponema sp.]|nr:GTP 3',8-cyclase MoaA [Treponema sp.]
MTDSFGRTINYLRLSITDRCNLRCVYCMPPDGVRLFPREQILTFEEIVRLCGIFAGLGINYIRVTGGEPMARNGAANLIRKLKAVNNIQQVAMTSNGILLYDHLEELTDAGLDSLNISLNTLNEETFRRITLSEGLHKVLAALDHAAASGLPVKVNCVPLQNINEQEIVQIAALAKDRNIAVRFIELMPMSCGGDFEAVPADEVLAALEKAYGTLTPFTGRLGNGPAVYYEAKNFRGKLGFISALSHEFCKSCNRLRLTAGGILKPCLAAGTGLDLKNMMRTGASDADIVLAVKGLAAEKPLRHGFEYSYKNGQQEMFRIGG